MSPLIAGLIASFCAGMATLVGALPVLLPVKYTRRAQGMMLGFGGGVMLAASAFSLIVPGTQAAIAQGSTKMEAALMMAMGLGLGAIFLKITHDLLPHEHFFKGFEGRDGANLKRIWLFIFAITLHNFPEGLAVGVNFANGDYSEGLPLAIGIGLQNLPEGLAYRGEAPRCSVSSASGRGFQAGAKVRTECDSALSSSRFAPVMRSGESRGSIPRRRTTTITYHYFLFALIIVYNKKYADNEHDI